MYSRSESGDGIARNLASHSRWAFADSAVKPRSSPVGAGARARSRRPRPQAAIERAVTRIRTEPRGKGAGEAALVFQLVPGVHLTPAHHQRDLADVADVREWIGVQHDQVSCGTRGNRSGAVESEGSSRVRGRRNEHVA